MAYSSRRTKKPDFFDTVKEVTTLLLIVFIIRTFGFGLYQVPTGSMETTMLVGERFFADKLSYLFIDPNRGDIISFNDPLFNYSGNKFVRLFQEYVWGPTNWTKRIIGLPGETIKGVVENGTPVLYINGKKLNEPYVNKHPLVPVYKSDPKEITRAAEKEALKLVAEGKLPGSKIQEFVAFRLEQAIEWRSMDISKPYENQDYYSVPQEWVITMLEPKNAGEPVLPRSHHLEEIDWATSPDNFEITLGADEYWVMGDNRRGSKDSRFIGALSKHFIHGRILFRIWSLDSYENWWIMHLIKNPVDFWNKMRWHRFLQFVR